MAGYFSARWGKVVAASVPVFAILLYQVAFNDWYANLNLLISSPLIHLFSSLHLLRLQLAW
jgi:hypothetical protein